MPIAWLETGESEEEARSYAERYDVSYPGIYVSPDGDLLVPPGLIFMRPAVSFERPYSDLAPGITSNVEMRRTSKNALKASGRFSKSEILCSRVADPCWKKRVNFKLALIDPGEANY